MALHCWSLITLCQKWKLWVAEKPSGAKGEAGVQDQGLSRGFLGQWNYSPCLKTECVPLHIYTHTWAAQHTTRVNVTVDGDLRWLWRTKEPSWYVHCSDGKDDGGTDSVGAGVEPTGNHFLYSFAETQNFTKKSKAKTWHVSFYLILGFFYLSKDDKRKCRQYLEI